MTGGGRTDVLWRAVALVSAAALFVVSVVISLRVNAESDRKWCSVVTTLDDAYREQPPTTPAGVNLAESIARLRRELHCPSS